MMSEEIKWEVGQDVWDVIFGKGVVTCTEAYSKFPIRIRFENDSREESFTKEGEYFEGVERSLFFSEPVVTAELFPPKKKFVPALKKGDVLVVQHVWSLEERYVLTVESEDEERVWFVGGEDGCLKTSWTFHKLGEEINFQ